MRRTWLLLVTVLWVSASATVARASIVERVVAVVGERPILFSDLTYRARPFLYQIQSSTQNPAQRAAAQSQVFHDLLDRMIDDRLEEQVADRAHLSVTPDEVDTALRTVASRAGIGVADLVAEAERQGLHEQDYRDELRRQLLEGKLIELRVRGRVRVTDGDARAVYARWSQEQVAPIPSYDTVRTEMFERAYGEAMQRQRKLWLGELRRGAYVDVRL
jgi:peptidyl-prolyl cis-trans isomerase SurA